MKMIGRVFENRLQYVFQACLRPSCWSRCLTSSFLIGRISEPQIPRGNKLCQPTPLWQIHRHLKSIVISSCLFMAGASHGLVLTSDFEVQLIPNVDAAGAAVSFDNVYANPVPVCTHNIVNPNDTGTPPNDDEAATVRISGLSSTGMTVYLQGVAGLTLTAADVHCIIMDEGDYTLAADGFEAEARLVESDGTNGRSDWDLTETEDVTSAVTGDYDAPVVLGQVVTSNDAAFSTFWTYNCDDRNIPPFELTDEICVGKHNSFIANASQPSEDETLGYIVFEESNGILNGVRFETAMGADIVRGVDNTLETYNLDLGVDYNFGVLTQSGEDGGDGSWAVLRGADPLAGGELDLGVDEANNGSRAHTHEHVNYIAFAAAELTLLKEVINDNGGDAEDTDFTLEAEGPLIDVGSGDGTMVSQSQVTQTGVEGDLEITEAIVYPDTYTLSEIAPGYAGSAWTCTDGTLSGSDLVLEIGDDAECTITNDDIPSQLTLEKVVNNTAGGGTADADDWTLEANIDGGAVEVSGTTGVSEAVDAGDYILTELNGPIGYTLEDLSCDAGTLDSGTSTLSIGLDQDITCTFTNRDLITDLEIIKTVSNENPIVGETVTFTLQVINNGPDDAMNVVIDDSVLAGYSFVASSMTGGDAQNQTAPGLVWTINSLPAGVANAVSLTYQAVVNAP